MDSPKGLKIIEYFGIHHNIGIRANRGFDHMGLWKMSIAQKRDAGFSVLAKFQQFCYVKSSVLCE